MHIWSFFLHFTSETTFFLLCVCTPESLCSCVLFARVCVSALACSHVHIHILYKYTQSYRCLPGDFVWGYRWPLKAALSQSGTHPTSAWRRTQVYPTLGYPTIYTCLSATTTAPGTSARTLCLPKNPQHLGSPLASKSQGSLGT